MERYIKYKRITEKFELNNKFQYNPQKFFDELITDGWEIIYYNEKEIKYGGEVAVPKLEITVVVGRKQKIEL